ncbi:PQQ-binding-like beta-propeller repeat protein [Streptomyces sp. 3MP-14]|uniref:PQQ-binding-like beta-propeller repeat protein n=1 Tax=Streptomyces mimosae TaxID=2586635 RepID=A0A5N5ZYZ5_9ACTN|nr:MULTISPECIES: PQQ-binding-like beta-propeller repeat protein [Streptomyces]KAB8161707.1 PQQ-binding-like beta-propeller repeat protein [Streptomyces mimosae]KAB8175025.1 PQQ-binding-like beta-propeller repeat protein [Streptomyces sp. 3MP-14]
MTRTQCSRWYGSQEPAGAAGTSDQGTGRSARSASGRGGGDTETTGASRVADGEGRIGLVAMVGVVLLALLTVWVVVFSREDGGTVEADATALPAETRSETPRELAELWAAPAVLAPVRGAGAELIRVWPHGETVTVVTAAAVRGYLTVDGREAWDAEPPPGAGEPCAAAPRANAAGLGALLYETADGGCSVLAVLDVATGEIRWWRQLVAGGAPVDAGGVAVAVGENTVSAGLDADGAPDAFHRFAVADGAPLPLPQPPPEQADAGCPDGRRHPVTARQRGNRLVVLSRCQNESLARELSAYDADTGEWEWTHIGEQDIALDVDAVVAGDPVLLIQGTGPERELVAYAESGQALWHRPLGATDEDAPARPGPLPGEHSVVAGQLLVTRYQPAPDAEPPADVWPLAGYELATGEQRWTIELAVETQLLGTDEAGRPLLAEPTGDDLLQVLALDPANGETAPVGTVPLSPDRAYDRQYAALDENQLYLLTAMSAPTQKLRLHAYER